MRSAAYAYASQNIRVNSVHPTGVATPMIFNEHMTSLFEANPEGTGMSDNLMPVPYVEAMDVTNAVTFLVSEKARYITGRGPARGRWFRCHVANRLSPSQPEHPAPRHDGAPPPSKHA
jgi:NAD(P)-dependent dehydrogenase (short-subunit alcohol dehydrogenase family)